MAAKLLALAVLVALSSCLVHERQGGFTREYTVIGP